MLGHRDPGVPGLQNSPNRLGESGGESPRLPLTGSALAFLPHVKERSSSEIGHGTEATAVGKRSIRKNTGSGGGPGQQ